jgi:cell division protease FtsH
MTLAHHPILSDHRTSEPPSKSKNQDRISGKGCIMNSVWKRLSPWIFFFVVVGLLVSTFYLQSQRKNVGLETTFSNFLSQLHEGRIHDVTISGQEIIGHFSDNRTFQTYSPPHANVSERLLSSHVDITVRPESAGTHFWWTVLTIGLLIILIAIWAYLWRFWQTGGLGGIRSTELGKSKAKLLTAMSGKVTFDDVAGVNEAKEDLQEIVEFLRDPGKFQRLGGRIPRGVLLVGPPGTGKTLLARAIAGEAGVPFFLISGSDFVEMFVGIGASRVRDMFEQAKKNAPCIIFVDEVDAVGRRRGTGLGGGNDEREQTLNQLLVEMDGFEANEGIILIAATNRPDVLDPALMRPGRFDRQIQVPNPDFIGREKILKVHARKVPLAPDVDLKIVARGTPGFSGADLMNLVNEAALLAARRSKRIVTNQEFEDARDKIMMGAERRTLSMTEEEKKLTAYHEGGHALVQLTVPGAMPIHKATIIPRGRALGMVQGLPERDQVSQTFEQLTAMLAIAMGGRVAEELIFGHDKVTSGAASDIQQCTRVARTMITQLGFSDKLGTVAYAEPQQEQFLGYSLGRQQTLSEATQQTIDAEVRRLVQEAYDKAKQILTEKKAQLDTLANGLLEFETLTGEEMKGLLQGKRPVRESMDVAPPDNENTNPNLSENSVSQANPQGAMEPLAAYRVRGEANLSTYQFVGSSR